MELKHWTPDSQPEYHSATNSRYLLIRENVSILSVNLEIPQEIWRQNMLFLQHHHEYMLVYLEAYYVSHDIGTQQIFIDIDMCV